MCLGDMVKLLVPPTHSWSLSSRVGQARQRRPREPQIAANRFCHSRQRGGVREEEDPARGRAAGFLLSHPPRPCSAVGGEGSPASSARDGARRIGGPSRVEQCGSPHPRPTSKPRMNPAQLVSTRASAARAVNGSSRDLRLMQQKLHLP